MKTAKEIAKSIIKDSLRENYDLSIPEIETKIINYTNQEIKKQTEELTMRLHLQKLHCKLFHRQKISVWLTGYWFRFKWWIKPMKEFKTEDKNYYESILRWHM